jgi:hypothetical protein
VPQINESEFFEKLEALGEEQVRLNIAQKVWTKDSGKLPLAEEWLRRLESSRISASESARSEREEKAILIAEEANSIAREALSSSRLANRLAISAIILSVVMAIQKVIEWYSIKP